MTGGTISENSRGEMGSSHNGNHQGGGVYVASAKGSFNMSGGRIENNNGHFYGGGVYVENEGLVYLSGDAVISLNYAAGTGGGIYVKFNSRHMRISCNESSCPVVSGNTAGTSSAANNIYLHKDNDYVKKNKCLVKYLIIQRFNESGRITGKGICNDEEIIIFVSSIGVVFLCHDGAGIGRIVPYGTGICSL